MAKKSVEPETPETMTIATENATVDATYKGLRIEEPKNTTTVEVPTSKGDRMVPMVIRTY